MAIRSVASGTGKVRHPGRIATSGSGGGGGPNPPFANVVSLLHLNGSAGSTTFTDQTGKTWTRTGTATIQTTQSVFGGASLEAASSNSILTVDNADWDFGSGDFTLEGRTFLNSVTGNHAMLAKIVTATGWGPFAIFTVGTTLYGRSSAGASWNVEISGGTVVVSTWFAWAFERYGNLFSLYLNGTRVAQTTQSFTVVSNAEPVYLGKYNLGSPIVLDGYADEFRATKGVGIYQGAASYTLATSEFPNS